LSVTKKEAFQLRAKKKGFGVVFKRGVAGIDILEN